MAYFMTNVVEFRDPRAPKRGDIISGVVSHIESPDLFYVNRSADGDRLKSMQKAIQEFYNANSNTCKAKQVKVGMPIIAKFFIDLNFYRAKVVAVDSAAQQLTVYFVDYGNTSIESMDDVYYITQEFFAPEKMALPCKLGEIEPSGGDTSFNWSQDAIFKMREFVQSDEIMLAITVLELANRRAVVRLVRWEGDQQINIAEELAKANYARLTKPVKEDGDKKHKALCQSIQALEKLTICPYAILKQMIERRKAAKACSTKDMLIPIRAYAYYQPTRFYVQLADSMFQDLVAAFNDNFTKQMCVNSCSEHGLRPLTNFAFGTPCAFKNPHSINVIRWLRGKVVNEETSIKTGELDALRVIAADYGLEMILPKNDVFEIPMIFLKHNPFALECKITGVRPAGGSDQWTQTAMNQFQSWMAERKDVLNILVKQDLPEQRTEPISCNVVAIENDIPGPLLPTKTVYVSLMDEMIAKMGIALPASSGVREKTDEELLNEEGEQGSGMYRRATRGPVAVEMPKNTYSMLIDMQVQQELDDFDGDEEILRFDVPNLPATREFMGLVTHVDEDGYIYFQEITLSGGNIVLPISEINEAITDYLMKSRLPPMIGSFHPGRAVTAKFVFDNSWNRAKLVSTAPGSMLTVCYVDYGGFADLPIEDISRKAFCTHVPELAIKAQLAGFTARPDQAQADVVRAITEYLVDKFCDIRWTNYSDRTAPMQIRIRPQDEEDELGEYLLKKQMVVEVNE